MGVHNYIYKLCNNRFVFSINDGLLKIQSLILVSCLLKIIASLFSIFDLDYIDNKNNLYLKYQPQLNKSNKVIGVEALLRWNYPILSYVPPNVVILISEEFNLIDRLGN